MSIRPLDLIMSITQSQNVKPLDSDQNVKHAQQTQIINDQNQKNKESVLKIPNDDNNTELMETIKQGMPEYQEDFHHAKQHEKKETQEEPLPDKGMLDDHNGNTIDIIG